MVLSSESCFNYNNALTVTNKENCFEYLQLVKLIVKYLLPYFFPLNTLKGIVKAPAVDLLRFITLRDSKTAFSNSKTDDKHLGTVNVGGPGDILLLLTQNQSGNKPLNA